MANIISKAKVKCKDSTTASLIGSSVVNEGIKFKNTITATCYDADGNEKWTDSGHNLMVDEGLEYILGVALSDETQDATHYIGLKVASGGIAAGDTLASHAGWTEATNYTGDRQAWVEAGVSSKTITNTASPASFSINGTGTVAGAFLCVPSTGSAQELIAVGDFAVTRNTYSGDTLEVTYELTIADA